MLVDTPMKVGDTISLKLTTSEEIIGKFVNEDDKQIHLSKPMTAIIHENGMGLMPYVMTVSPETTIKFNKQLVIATEKTAKPIAEEYDRNTSSLAI